MKKINQIRQKPKRSKILQFSLIILIVALGCLLRTLLLTEEDIWLDEAFSVYQSHKSVGYIIELTDQTPPLYNILLHCWMNLFGNTLWNARFLSVIFGTVSIYLIYLLGKELSDSKVGMLSALFLAISPLHVYVSQEARTYAMFFMFSLASMLFYIRLGNKNSTGNFYLRINYCLSSIFLLYSHVYGLLILLAQNLDHLIKCRFKLNKRYQKFLLLQSIVFIFFIPWLLKLRTILAQKLYAWTSPPTLIQLQELVYNLTSGMGFSIAGSILSLYILFLLLTNKKIHMLLFIWIVVPILVPIMISILIIPIYIPKYIFFTQFPLLILLSMGLVKRKGTLRYFFTLLLIVLMLFTLQAQQKLVTKNQWSSVSEHISSRNYNKRPVVIINSYMIQPFAFYHIPECFYGKEVFSCARENEIFPIDDLAELKELNLESFWLILAHEQHNPEITDIIQYLEDNYIQQEQILFVSEKTSPLAKKIFSITNKKATEEKEEDRIRVFHYRRI
ncbi:MAG: glycosyltransferase family 39 protein [Nanoarchaeota archaeon]|nr:glycosyltransferase family 39 protein [Nanoarchaeota archaeon]